MVTSIRTENHVAYYEAEALYVLYPFVKQQVTLTHNSQPTTAQLRKLTQAASAVDCV